jgi:hypothetical protein
MTAGGEQQHNAFRPACILIGAIMIIIIMMMMTMRNIVVVVVVVTPYLKSSLQWLRRERDLEEGVWVLLGGLAES